MSEAQTSETKTNPLIVGIRFQKIGKPRKAMGSFIAQLSAVARSAKPDEAILLGETN